MLIMYPVGGSAMLYHEHKGCHVKTELAVVRFMAQQGPLLLTWFNFNLSMDK